jgi:hypothetical protein
MTDESDNAEMRLVDFGLSKIVGPNELATEPFGTLVNKINVVICSSRSPIRKAL